MLWSHIEVISYVTWFLILQKELCHHSMSSSTSIEISSTSKGTNGLLSKKTWMF